jgi:hypothetical protein
MRYNEPAPHEALFDDEAIKVKKTASRELSFDRKLVLITTDRKLPWRAWRKKTPNSSRGPIHLVLYSCQVGKRGCWIESCILVCDASSLPSGFQSIPKIGDEIRRHGLEICMTRT